MYIVLNVACIDKRLIKLVREAILTKVWADSPCMHRNWGSNSVYSIERHWYQLLYSLDSVWLGALWRVNLIESRRDESIFWTMANLWGAINHDMPQRSEPNPREVDSLCWRELYRHKNKRFMARSTLGMVFDGAYLYPTGKEKENLCQYKNIIDSNGSFLKSALCIYPLNFIGFVNRPLKF